METPKSTTEARGHAESFSTTAGQWINEGFRSTNSRVQNPHFSSLSARRQEGKCSTSPDLNLPTCTTRMLALHSELQKATESLGVRAPLLRSDAWCSARLPTIDKLSLTVGLVARFFYRFLLCWCLKQPPKVMIKCWVVCFQAWIQG